MMSAATAPPKGPARLGSVGPFGPPSPSPCAVTAGCFTPSGRWSPAPEPDAMGLDGERDVYMRQTARFQETLRRLALIDESCVEDQAGLALGPAEGSSLDPKTEALLRLGATAAIGASPVCLEWSTGRALAAGASEDEIADVLLAIAPVAGLGRIVSAAPGVAIALGYDTQATRQEPDEATRQEPDDHERPGERFS
jgi:4-carboxymuconolactone decarboxylase